VKSFKALKDELDALGAELLLVSADSPASNLRFRKALQIPFRLVSDEDHAVADRFGVPISHKHPKARSYQDGFIQPAVFAYRGEQEVFTFVQTPSFTNLWGAARRPTPRQVLDAIKAKLG
jgi:AhpC/TSA family